MIRQLFFQSQSSTQRARAGTESFKETVLKYEITQGLSIFSKTQLTKIAQELFRKGGEWKPRRSTFNSLMNIIVNKAKREDITQVINRLITREELPSITQRGEWIVGPFGILRSRFKRKPFQSSEFLKILRRYIDRSTALTLRNIVKDIPDTFVLKKDDPLLLSKCFQLLFVFADDQKIIEAINSLIQRGVLRIENNRKFWDYIVTPCGIFEKEYGGAENLSELILREFKESELSKWLGGETNHITLKTRVLERCIKERRPGKILNDLFRLFDLWRIANNLGLVSVERIEDKERLIDIVLIRLGFSIPSQLEGLRTFEEILNKSKTQLEDPRLSVQQKTGIMTVVYAQTESILKDLIYFYVSFLWFEKIDQNFEPEEKKRAADQNMRREFRVDKNVDEMNLGPLIGLIRQIEKRLRRNSKLRQQLEKEFGRITMLGENQIDVLNRVSPFRPLFGHDVRVNGRRKEIDTQKCIQIISELEVFTRGLKERDVYPCLIRITKEVTDEYGTKYDEAIDEDNKPWTIKSNSWLEAGPTYFMHSKTKPIAIHPFILVRFW